VVVVLVMVAVVTVVVVVVMVMAVVAVEDNDSNFPLCSSCCDKLTQQLIACVEQRVPVE
jgi:hypothetical protein